MKYSSIWLDENHDNNVCELDEDKVCDVLIIGGGMTGLSCAYHLMNSKLKVVLVEANKVGMGISLRTTGKLTFLQENIYSKLNDNISYKSAKLYYESQLDAIKIVTDIINKNNILCDLENVTSYVFTDKEKEIKKLKKEQDILASFGCKIKTNTIPLDIDSLYQISTDNSYVFNPLKYIRGLKDIVVSKGINIYENTKIIDINKGKHFNCKTKNHTIKAKKIVLACHYPFFFNSCLLPLKSYIEKSFIISLNNQENKKISLINLSKPIKSIRFYNNKMLFLSSTSLLCDKLNFADREKDLVTYLKDNKNISHCWSNHDIMTNDCLPIIGEIYKDVYIGTGYNTWGMTNGNLAGKIISDLITNKKNRYVSLFNPNRKFNKLKLYNTPLCLYASAKGFIKGYLKYNAIVTYKCINNERVACYKGYYVKTKCPHMKCPLIFNYLEKTWDCPCHGSRFNYDGSYIIGPSKTDIIFRKD